jgi:hypothetical protein
MPWVEEYCQPGVLAAKEGAVDGNAASAGEGQRQGSGGEEKHKLVAPG